MQRISLRLKIFGGVIARVMLPNKKLYQKA